VSTQKTTGEPPWQPPAGLEQRRSGSTAPAIGFVNERGLQVEGERDARVAIVRSWLEAGMTLGNHGFRHQDLSDPVSLFGGPERAGDLRPSSGAYWH
jgi:hypothetical protein